MSDLLPCPFCGDGETQMIPQNYWTGMSNTVLSVTIRHWCETEEGQPKRCIDRIGRDESSAIQAWNRRAAVSGERVREALPCPYPFNDDDGTQSQCIERGHCGCSALPLAAQPEGK